MEKKLMTKRIILSIVGIFLTSISVSFSKISGFGVDPYSVLMFGIVKTTGLTYQAVFLTACTILAVIAFKINKSLLGFATLFCLFGTGIIVDMTTPILENSLGSVPSLPVRITCMAISLILISVASALYYTANLGVSPYDSLALMLGEKTPVPFRFCRIGTDLVCVGIGFLLGGDLGIGTMLIAFCMGPAIQFCRDYISDPILERRLFNPEPAKKLEVYFLKNILGFKF